MQNKISPIARWSSLEIFIAAAIKYSEKPKIQVRSLTTGAFGFAKLLECVRVLAPLFGFTALGESDAKTHRTPKYFVQNRGAAFSDLIELR